VVTLVGGGICIVLIGSVSPLEKTAVGAEPPPSRFRHSIVCSIWNRMSSGYNAMTMRRCSGAFDVARIRMLRR
jgi:hypothetical protein